MGSCISKKATSSPSPLPVPPLQIYSTATKLPETKKPQEESFVKKEDFIFKRRKSHEIIDIKRSEEERVTQVAEPAAGINSSSNNGGFGNYGNGIVAETPIRTSSCTKEEVDAILIQCGRLSRSSSTDKAALSGSNGSCDITSSGLQRGRKYSGSKRSFDFDNEVGAGDKCHDEIVDDGDEGVADRIHRHRQRHRESRAANSSPLGRRRTPSREREQQRQRQQQQQQQRTGSRERGGSSSSGGGGRRVSRSPGRRSESPVTTNSNGVNGTALSGNASCRPGKMVSVPATVSSLAVDKSNNAGGGGVVEPPSAAAIKRVQVRRNVGEAAVGTRTAASPRSRSPARTNVKASNENQSAHSQQQPQLSLSRSNSRKAEQSPYRRNPLSEIDNNVIGCEKPAVPNNKSTNNNTLQQAAMQEPSSENLNDNKVVQGTDNKGSSNRGTREQQKQLVEEAKGLQPMTGKIEVTVIPSGTESLKPQGLTRSRSSSRLSRDLDLNPETLTNPNPSYTALLLEDINNFHQKSTPTPAFSLPPCVTKACSILDAVADLNSTTSSTNLSCAFADDRISNPTAENYNKNEKNSSAGANVAGKKRLGTKDPIVESEVVVSNDLMEPSFHKYVTVRRGAAEEGGDTEEQESSGSNSFVGSQQHWLSSSSWEPNSADSTDCYTSSRTNTRQSELSPLGLQRPAFSESGREMDEPHRRFSEKKRIPDNRHNGIGRGRVGSGGGLYSMPIAAAAST